MSFMIPKMIHMASTEGKYCGYVQEGSWAEKYMDDKVARKLPLCPDCLEIYARRHGEKAKQRVMEYKRKMMEDDYVHEVVETRTEVPEDAPQTKRGWRTLREYLG